MMGEWGLGVSYESYEDEESVRSTSDHYNTPIYSQKVEGKQPPRCSADVFSSHLHPAARGD